MKTLLSLVLLVLLAVPAHAYTTDSQEDICATAAVIYCDNFEDRTVNDQSPWTDLTRTKYKNSGWIIGSGASNGIYGVSTTDAYDGTKSFRMKVPVNGSGSYLDTGYFNPGRPHSNLYIRQYVKWSSNWVLSTTSEKHWELNGGFAAFLFNTISMKALSIGVPYHINPPLSGNQFQPNLGITGDLTRHGTGQSQWDCVEAHIIMNSTTSSFDGTAEMWLNGVKFLEHTNVHISNNSQRGIDNGKLSAYWNCYNPGTGCDYNDSRSQHPEMYRWHDNIVVSTERIGCLGEAPVLTNPRQPINLRRAEVENFVELRDGDDYVTRVSR